MRTIKIKYWEEFEQCFSKKHYRKWIFRGQCNSDWGLESSLSRAFDEASSIYRLHDKNGKTINRYEHEKVMIDRFSCNAHIYLNTLPENNDLLSWLSLMQHHGAPTRLLDFTFSYNVALFFALESGLGDAAVYGINHHAIKNDDDALFGSGRLEKYSNILSDNNSDDPFLFSFEPTFSNQRLLSQQGLFVATNNLEYTHENIITAYDLSDEDVIKIIIPKELRYLGLRRLNQMNINTTNIYPGLDGFSKSLRRQATFGLEYQRRVGK